MNLRSYRAALTLLVLVFSGSNALSQRLGEFVELRGSVISTERKPITDAKLQFVGRAGSFAAHAKSDGTYSLQIPEGTFTIHTSAKGFCERRQDVKIESLQTRSLAVALMECSDCPPMNVDFSETNNVGLNGQSPDVRDFSKLPSMKYETSSLPGLEVGKFQPLVMFGKRSEGAQASTFTGLFCPGHENPAVVAYFGATISAHKFVYSPQEKMLTGEGDVLLLDERGLRRGTRIKIQFAEGAPSVGLK